MVENYFFDKKYNTILRTFISGAMSEKVSIKTKYVLL